MISNRSKKLKIICSLFILFTVASMPLAGISYSSAQAAELSGRQEAPRRLPPEEPLPPGTTECRAANSSLQVEPSTYQLPQLATGRHILYVGKSSQPSSLAQLTTELTAATVSTKEIFDGRCISWAREIDGADVDIFSTKDLFWICTTVEWVEGAEQFLNDLLKALAKAYGLPGPVDCQITDSINMPMVNPDGTIDVAGMQVANSPSPNFYTLITKGEAAAGYGVSESAVALEMTANQVNWIVQTEDGVERIAAMTYHRQESNEYERLNNTVINPLAKVVQAPPASPDLSHTDYVIMYKSSLSGWSSVINALHAKHSDYQDLTFVNEVSEKLGDLQTIKPKYVIIVIKPEDADPDFLDDVDSAMCQIDADEFEDAVWSVITGFSSADALALVNAPDATNDHTLTIANPDGSLPGAGYAGTYLAGIIADDATNGGGSPTKYVNTASSSASVISASNLQTEINSDNKDCVLFLDHGNTYGWGLRKDPTDPSYSDWFYAGRSSLETYEERGSTYYTLNNNKNSFVYSESCLTSRINGKRNTSWAPWEYDDVNYVGDKATSIALAWMEDSPGFYVSNDAVSYGNPHIKTVLLNMMKFGYTPAEAVQISKNVYHYIIGDETSEDNPSDGHVDDLLLYLEREFVGLGDTSWDISIAGSPPDYSISYSSKTQQDQEATTRGYVYVDSDIKWRCTTSLNFNEEIYREFGIAAHDEEQSPFTTVYVKDVTGGGGSVSGYPRTVIAGTFKPTMDAKSVDFVSGNPSDSGKLCDDLTWHGAGSSEADEMFKCKENTDELIWVVRVGITDADSNSKYEWRINNGYSESFPTYYYLPGVEQTVGTETVVDSDTRQKSVTLRNQGSQAVANVIAKVPVPSDASNFSVTPSTGVSNIIKTSDGGAYCEFTLDSIAAGATKNLTLQYDIAAGPSTPTVSTNAATLVEKTTATLNGAISDDGGEACQYRFGYGTTQGGPYTYTTWSVDTKSSGQSFSQSIPGLSTGTKYYFIAQAKNSAGTASGTELTFITGDELNTPPNTPSNPSPTNHDTGVSIDADLSWSGGDPDAGDTVTYDVYFGTGSPPPFKASIGPYPANQTCISYDPGLLNHDIKYYWKIVATDNHGASTTGPLWDFTTVSPPSPGELHVGPGQPYATIQEGIDDASAGDTIIVHPGTYDGFIVENKNNIGIIGQEGVTVNSANMFVDGGEWWVMAFVMNCTNINIEDIVFDGEEIEVGMLEGIAYGDSTGSITGGAVRNIIGSEMAMGVCIWGGEEGSTAVDTSDLTVENCVTGLMVSNAEANLDGCSIAGMAPNGGYDIMAIDNAQMTMQNCDIRDCWKEEPQPGEAGLGIMIGMPEEYEAMYGIEDERMSTVQMTGCTISHNNVGIQVDDDGDLIANYNNIQENNIIGVYKENPPSVDATNNWWGDASGPSGAGPGTGDAVSDNVDYDPWLKAEITPVAIGLATIDDCLVVVYGFDKTTKTWTWYNPSWPPEANTLTTLHMGSGYWINVSESCTLTYEANTYPLDEGWNLIGWEGYQEHVGDNPAVAVGLASIEDWLEVVYGFDSAAKTWTWYNPSWPTEANTLTVLYKGGGYWVNVSGACDLTYEANTYELDEGWNLIGWLGS